MAELSSPSSGCISPGGTIGILGGGQLGRMTALAAARLGYRTHVFTEEAEGPCAQVAAAATIAAYDDEVALAAFAHAVDVVTLEFENVPLETARFLAERRPFHPSPSVLAVTQVRSTEKSQINWLGFGTAPWIHVTDPKSLADGLARIGYPAILKTDRMGYDGKGQMRINAASDPAAVWAEIGRVPCVLEGFVDFACEVSVVLARGQDGKMASYPPVLNHHRNGILSETIAPALIDGPLAAEAIRMAERIAASLDFVGVLAVEMFVTRDNKLLINEIAPRPHNSGHWTIDACQVSQFEQHARAVCGLPLGPTERHSNARMLNLIGDDAAGWAAYMADPAARLHLYGKAEMRPGRKMGHVTWLSPQC